MVKGKWSFGREEDRGERGLRVRERFGARGKEVGIRVFGEKEDRGEREGGRDRKVPRFSCFIYIYINSYLGAFAAPIKAPKKFPFFIYIYGFFSFIFSVYIYINFFFLFLFKF